MRRPALTAEVTIAVQSMAGQGTIVLQFQLPKLIAELCSCTTQKITRTHHWYA
eukprot:COSAG02_NODE_27845_length_601_cov_1.195219_1_plen_53_part_00